MRFRVIFIAASFCSLLATAQQKVTVDVTKENQTISGFGAFGGIKAYWESPPFYTDAFINSFLNDLGVSIVRTNIPWDLELVNDNSSPLSLDLSKFNYKPGSTMAGQLQYYKALKDAGLKKLIATAWTPPVWMKIFDDAKRTPKDCYNCNNCPVGDPNRKVCGGRLDPKYYYEYAEYLIAFVKIIKQEIGVDLYGVNIQNEPYFANPFEANVMLPDEYADVLEIVGKRFREENLLTKFFGPEHMAEWSWGVQKNYVSEILGDANVEPYLDIYAVHGYVDGVAPDYGSADGWTSLKDNIVTAHKKALWMTETSGYPQTITGAMDLAKSMYLALRFGNISGWVYWAVSGSPGSDMSIMSNGSPTILYYASKQFFKFIRPGAIRVEASSENPDVLPLAFKNPSTGQMTLVLINNSSADVSIQPDISIRPTQFTIYRTSASQNSEALGTYTSRTIVLPAKSISTLVGNGPSAPSFDEIQNYYITAGHSTTLQIPLTSITDGGGGEVKVDVQISNTAVVPSVGVSYSYPSASGLLTLSPNTATPGRSLITVKLTNLNNVNGSTFGFNATQQTFIVEVVDAVTALKKSDAQAIAVYPNPATGLVMLDVSSLSSPQTIEIHDDQGRIVYSETSQEVRKNISLDTSGWKAAVYVITLSDKKQRIVQKLFVR